MVEHVLRKKSGFVPMRQQPIRGELFAKVFNSGVYENAPFYAAETYDQAMMERGFGIADDNRSE